MHLDCTASARCLTSARSALRRHYFCLASFMRKQIGCRRDTMHLVKCFSQTQSEKPERWTMTIISRCKCTLGVRWVVVSKHDVLDATCRSRLVAKEIKWAPMPELYDATPSQECCRMILSSVMTSEACRPEKKRPVKLLVCDGFQGILLSTGNSAGVREDS